MDSENDWNTLHVDDDIFESAKKKKKKRKIQNFEVRVDGPINKRAKAWGQERRGRLKKEKRHGRE